MFRLPLVSRLAYISIVVVAVYLFGEGACSHVRRLKKSGKSRISGYIRVGLINGCSNTI